MKKIKITLGKDGSKKIEVEGYKGNSCEKATEFLDNIFGKAENVILKSSYYEEEENTVLRDGLPSNLCG